MSVAKKLATVAMACVLGMATLVAGVGSATTALAEPSSQEVAQPQKTIPYAGQLQRAAGQPAADGAYDFTFSLYDTPEDGNLLWSETQTGIAVQAGGFAASLGSKAALPKAVTERKECWLAVSVRGPSEAKFTALAPRQLLPTDVQASIDALSCPHSHFTDSWAGSNPGWGLYLENTSVGDGLRAYSQATAWNYAAVFGANVATTGYGTGVYGYSVKGLGMRAGSGSGDGIEAVTDTTGGKSAVYAHSDKGNGVWAWSTSAVGVHGASTTGRGVEGYSNSSTQHAAYFESANYGPAYFKALKPATYYAGVFENSIHVLGFCTGCAVVYVGMNRGDPTIVPGDLVAAAGVEVDFASGQPVMQVRRAVDAGDAVIGVALGPAAEPSDATRISPETPGKAGSEAVAIGEYLRIMVSGLARVRVGNTKVAIGEHLVPGANGAVATADASNSVARVMSPPDANGLAWVMVNAR